MHQISCVDEESVPNIVITNPVACCWWRNMAGILLLGVSLTLPAAISGCDKTSNEATRVCSALGNGDFATAKTLIDAGIDINTKSETVEIPDFRTSRDGTMKILGGTYIINAAVDANWIEGVKLLVTKHVTLNVRNYDDGDTPLSIAVSKNSLELVTILLDAGANPKYPARVEFDRYPITSVRFSTSDGRKILELLLRKGADINAKSGKQEGTLLHLAAGSLDLDSASFLISKGADVNVVDANGHTPCAVAIKQNGWGQKTQDFVAYLKSHGATDDTNKLVRENLSN